MEAYSKTSRNRIQLAEYRTDTNIPSYPTKVDFPTSNVRTINCDSTMSGSKNPQWRDQVKAHVSATTPFQGNETKVLSSTPSSATVEWMTNGSSGPITGGNYFYYRKTVRKSTMLDTSGYYDAWIVPPAGNSAYANADNQAIARLYDTLQSFEGTNGIGEDLGELGQTVKLLTNPLGSLRKGILSVVDNFEGSLKRKRGAELVKGLADAALEYKFGVVPLCNQIANVTVALQNREVLANYYPFHCSGKSDSFEQGPAISQDYLFDTTGRRTFTSEVIYRGQWSAEAGADQRAVSDILGLRFKDILPTVWNLLPYSWMADYVSNVGTIVQSVSVPWGNVAWCCKTVRNTVLGILSQRETYSRFATTYAASNPWNKSLSPGSFSWQGKYTSRSIVYNIPRPEFRLNPVQSASHMFNLGALLTQKLVTHSGLLSAAVKREPRIHDQFQAELYRRRERIPYPFHSQ
jgi:hypothetical protein